MAARRLGLAILLTIGGCIVLPVRAPKEGVKQDAVVKGPFTQVALNEGRACGLSAAGEVACWTMHITGLMSARPRYPDEYKPVRQPVPQMRRISLAARDMHCGVTVDSLATCWGNLAPVLATDNALGARNVGDTLRFAGLSAGSDYLCGVAAGTAWCWGVNAAGALGTDSAPRISSPRPVLPLEQIQTVAVVSDETGEPHSCALTTSGDVWCWGSNEYGQAGGSGRRDLDYRQFEPRRVRMPAPATDISLSPHHSCALGREGEAWCWGFGMSGVLGVQAPPDPCGEDPFEDGMREIRCARNPVAVETNLRFSAISVARHHACGLTAEGEAWCWGSGVSGMLPPGHLERVSVPRRAPPPPGGAPYVSLASGADRTCATTPDGAVHCWRFTIATIGHLEQQSWSIKYFLKQMFVIQLLAVLGWWRGVRRGHPVRWAIVGAIVGVAVASLWLMYDLLSGLANIR